MAYPIRVEVNEDSILKLTTLYKNAYKAIVDEIATATNFGVKNRKAILKQIKSTLQELGVDTQKFLEKELPEYYKSGADDAIEQLKKLDSDISISFGFNQIHKEAIAALIDDTARAFGETLSGVSRSANRLMGKATRDLITQKLAEGNIGGKASKDIAKSIKGILQEEGLDALIDKGGRKWKLDTYADMLLRTKAVEARNRGLANRMVENSYDLVQVSDHQGECELCRPWEGKILSLTGVTRGYPTLAQAESEGLFHPNCRHAINTVVPELAQKTNAYDPDTKTLVIKQ